MKMLSIGHGPLLPQIDRLTDQDVIPAFGAARPLKLESAMRDEDDARGRLAGLFVAEAVDGLAQGHLPAHAGGHQAPTGDTGAGGPCCADITFCTNGARGARCTCRSDKARGSGRRRGRAGHDLGLLVSGGFV